MDLAAAYRLVALFKWIGLAFVPKPSKRKVSALLDAVGRRDTAEAESLVQGMRGPIGRMLSAGVAHLGEPRELIEEVMYETVLTARLKMQRFLPFIAICAASAPLLGLLGTVTGIISTFKLITVFGSGDVKTLSGGISEALITTEFGLIIAIPSLLIHAFLSRKARAIVGRMETAAMAFVIAPLSSLTAADLAQPREPLGRFSRGRETFYRLRSGDYRLYFTVVGENLHTHCILHRNTLTDFIFRSKLPITEEQLVEQHTSFWKYLETLSK